jgi:copper transport protein
MTSRTTRSIPRWLLTVVSLVLAAGAAVLWAPAAAAHSSVSETSPSDGQVIAQYPQQVAVEFNETVTVAPGSFQLVDAAGQQTTLPDPVLTPSPEGSRAVSSPVPELIDGWYAVRWSAVSADGHPVKGTFTFYVGDPAAASAAQEVDQAAFDDPAAPYRLASPLLRAAAYLTGMLAVGGLAAAWALSSSRFPVPAAVLSRARRVAAVSAAAGLVLAPLTLLNNAVLLGGGTFDSIGATVQLILQSPIGASLLVRMSALFAACTAVLLLLEPSTRRIGYAAGVLAGTGIAASYAMAGHAAVVDGSTIAMLAEVTHLLAAALWLGAVPAVAFALHARKELTVDSAAEVVDRFSKLATISVVLVIVGGIVLSTQMFTSADEVVSTVYGLTLIGKTALVAVVGLVGAYNHFVLVPRMRSSAPDATKSSRSAAFAQLKGTMIAEAGLLVAILVATAMLTSNAAPKAGGSHDGLAGHSHGGFGSESGSDLDLQLALADLDPRVATAAVLGGEVEVAYLPGRSDQENRFTLSLFDASGSPLDAETLTVAFSLPELGIEPLERTFERTSPGVWTLSTRDLGTPGQWVMRVDLTTSDGRLDFAELPVSISPSRAANTGGAL